MSRRATPRTFAWVLNADIAAALDRRQRTSSIKDARRVAVATCARSVAVHPAPGLVRDAADRLATHDLVVVPDEKARALVRREASRSRPCLIKDAIAMIDKYHAEFCALERRRDEREPESDFAATADVDPAPLRDPPNQGRLLRRLGRAVRRWFGGT